jgi:hypothetical protein
MTCLVIGSFASNFIAPKWFEYCFDALALIGVVLFVLGVGKFLWEVMP